jgi:heme-degrading monooxygenase HmoA
MMLVLFDTEPRADIDTAEYERAGSRMAALVSQMPGFVSAKRYSSSDGESFTMVKFASEEALEAWRRHPEHVAVQARGREEFYERYWVLVCQSVREYEWRRGG